MIKIHLCVIDRYVCGIIVQFILATGVSASGDAEHRISVVRYQLRSVIQCVH